jgi:hypothetical protein
LQIFDVKSSAATKLSASDLHAVVMFDVVSPGSRMVELPLRSAQAVRPKNRFDVDDNRDECGAIPRRSAA